MTTATVFREHPDPHYPGRTEWNAANADVTLDFARRRGDVFVGSGGSRGLTRLMTLKHKRTYIGIPITPPALVPEAAAGAILAAMPSAPVEIRVNVAGNGISSAGGIPQGEIDAYVTATLRIVAADLATRDQRLALVMSGGQTGFDEAGIIAGRALGIATLVTAPRGWLFRGADGRDIADRAAFMARFER